MSTKFRVGILTVSDRCYAGESTDTSGPNLRNIIIQQHLLNADVSATAVLPDDQYQIEALLIKWSDELKLDMILTTGGTGFAPRDVTPEATRKVIDKEAPGLALVMLQSSLEVTPMAALSRAVCGIRHRTLIVNLPGSKKASDECFRFVVATLPHALALLRQDLPSVEKTHAIVQNLTTDAVVTDLLGQHRHHHCSHSNVRTDQVIHRPRQSQFPMISVKEAQTIVLEQCHSTVPPTVEEISIENAVNRVLAQDYHSLLAVPPFPASAKDGYAVVAADGVGKRSVWGTSVAGSAPESLTVRPGICARISTGAPIPPGADAVVMVEETKLLKATDQQDTPEELEIEIMSQTEIKVGQDIRPIGCDVALGQLVLSAGRMVSAADVGLLAAVGVAQVKVYRLLVVAVLSTGNELQDSLNPTASDKNFIRDSNRPALLALFRERGFPVLDAGIAPDEPSQLLQSIQTALSQADVLVTTGGVSMGEKDYLRQVVLADFKFAELHFARVNMKPGKPTTFLTCQYEGRKKLLFGLPGNPVSAVVTAHLYVLPACRRLTGMVPALPTVVQGRFQSSAKVYLDARPEYHRVRLNWNPMAVSHSEEHAFLPEAISTGNQLSSRLLSMVEANGLAVLPAKTTSCKVIAEHEHFIVDVLVIDRI